MKMLLAGLCLCLVAVLDARQSLAADAGSVRRPVVYDAKGRAAGLFYGGSGFAVLKLGDAFVQVFLEFGSHGERPDPALLRWGESRARSGPQFWFSRDCSGVPFIDADTGDYFESGMRPVVVVRDVSGDLLIHIAAKGLSSIRRYQSVRDSTGTCRPESGTVNSWPVERTVNLSALHPEPLAVR